jgi:hypothetical protein
MNRSTNFASANPSNAGSPRRGGRIATIASSGGLTQNEFASFQRLPSASEQVFAGEEQNLWLLRKQREELQELRELQKEQVKKEIEVKRVEIQKAKQVSDVMKHVIKVEQEANMRMYQKFNREEKDLI